jgi:hypothetical protein
MQTELQPVEDLQPHHWMDGVNPGCQLMKRTMGGDGPSQARDNRSGIELGGDTALAVVTTVSMSRDKYINMATWKECQVM